MRGTLIQYNGYTLKSKIEYAWAQEFDRLGYDWEYEPVKFGKYRSYTPDFRLSEYNIFVEIKPYDGGSTNNYHLCPEPLLKVYGMPEKHYIQLKRKGDLGFSKPIFNTWSTAFMVARLGIPSWIERLP